MSLRATIRTPRIALVPLDPATAAELVAGRDGGLVAGRGWPHADTVDSLLAGLHGGNVDALPWLVLLVVDSDEPCVIGDVGWKGTPGPDGRVEIGYGLAAPYRRQGYATEAVGAFVGWLEACADVVQIDAEVRADNVASRRLLECLGFTIALVEGHFIWYGRTAVSSH